MNQVIDFAQDKESCVMFASTAHYFMQLLKSFLSSAIPKGVLHLAESVVRSSEKFGYTLDSVAVMDIVEFVENCACPTTGHVVPRPMMSA